jgi:ribosome-associated protein
MSIGDGDLSIRADWFRIGLNHCRFDFMEDRAGRAKDESGARELRVSSAVEIPDEEIQLSFVRSSGPGGQNVNKVATAVQLRFDVARSDSLSEEVRERLVRIAGRRINEDGVLVIEAKSSRSQSRNRQRALAKLRDLLRQAERKPRHRVATSPSAASKERRLQEKKQRGEVKRRRGWKPDDG